MVILAGMVWVHFGSPSGMLRSLRKSWKFAAALHLLLSGELSS
jgi:hypothetical protein